MYYLFLFHSKNDCMNAPQYYVIRTLPVFFLIVAKQSPFDVRRHVLTVELMII